MLVAGVNDDEADVRRVADFVRSLDPSRAYVSVPVRPATAPWARRPLADVARGAAEVFAATGVRTTLLSSDQAEVGFAPSPDAIEGLIGILAVHPMSERAARRYIDRSAADWRHVEELISGGAIVRVERDLKTYLRADLARLGLTDGPQPMSVGRERG
jgi:wyosine [tRNA(Phe)-imidazoG37] synthetase (radical SAM superfamily)